MAIRKARHACAACRRLKRKCDRLLPTCSLCVRLEKPCQYTAVGTSPPSDTAPGATGTDADLLFPAIEPPQQVPAAFFLEGKCFTPLHPINLLDSTPQPFLEQAAATHVPVEQRPALLDVYSSSVHRWLPILSMKRLVRSTQPQPEACQDLLVLCMKLCTMQLSEVPPARDPLYLLIRSAASAAEASGLMSLRLVQSLVLLSVYELGHAIYPAAYLTIGRAARLGTLMGWHEPTAHKLFQVADTLTVREEQLRTWWAIFIFDRFVNADTKTASFAAPEPSQDAQLPADDADWNRGITGASESLYSASFSSATTLGSFARTCQAAHMLSKVINHKESRTKGLSEVAAQLDEAGRLNQALYSFQLSLRDHANSDSTTLAAASICITAKLLLYNTYACRDLICLAGQERISQEAEMQRLSMESFKDLGLVTMPKLARGSLECPLIANGLYGAAKSCAWVLWEDDDAVVQEALRLFIGSLRRLGQRWNVAHEFLQMLNEAGVLTLAHFQPHAHMARFIE